MRTHLFIGTLCVLLGFAVSVSAQTEDALSGTETATPTSTQAVPTATVTPATGPLNFNNADLPAVLKYLSEKTGKPVVKSATVNKKITIINPKVQTNEENLRLLYKLLSSYGVAIVDAGEYLHVMELAEARKQNLPILTDPGGPTGLEEPFTFSRKLKHAKASEIVARLGGMVRDKEALSADDASNTLFYTDTKSSVERVAQLIDQLDQEPAGDKKDLMSLTYSLKKSTLDAVLPVFQEFLAHQNKLRGKTESEIMYVTEAASNSIMILGPTDEVILASDLLQQLDSDQVLGRERKMYNLERVQASKIQPTVEELLNLEFHGPNKPIVKAYPESNSLLIIAQPFDHIRAREIIASLEEPESYGVETRLFRLKNASAASVVASLKGSVGSPDKLVADAGSNSVVYTDNPANLARIGALIRSYDEQIGPDELISRTIPLKHASGVSIADPLQRLVASVSSRLQAKGRAPVQAYTDPKANAVVIIGATEDVQQLEQIVQSLDIAPLAERRPEIIFLERVQASKIQPTVEEFLNLEFHGPTKPIVKAYPESNSLLIIAEPSDHIRAREIIENLDKPESYGVETRLFRLNNASAQAVVTSLKGAVGNPEKLVADAGSNSVVYTDTPANLARIGALIRSYDEQIGPDELISRTIPLKHASAASIAEPLQKLVASVSSRLQAKGRTPVQAYTDSKSNAVVLMGAAEDVQQLERIVQSLDIAPLAERRPELISLKFANAEELGQRLQMLFAQTRQPGGSETSIVGDSWSNTLVVLADPRDVEWIRQLIKVMDTEEGGKRDIEIRRLDHAEATDLAEKLTELFQFGGQQVGGSRSRSRSRWSYYGYGGGGRGSTSEEEVSIIADTRLNALIITAKPQDMAQVLEMIELLDIKTENLEGPFVYHIEHAEAESVAETLEDLFSDTDYEGAFYFPIERDIGVSGLAGKIRVIAAPTTNSIIVLASTPRAKEVVEYMIKELDQPSVQAGQTNIIPVKNARAQDLAELLNDLFAEEQEGQGGGRRFYWDFMSQGDGGGASFSNLIGKVRIKADTRTNSLLVITPDLYRDSLKELVDELDRPTSQVLLEVLIAEVSLTNDEEKGIQWGVDPLNGDVGRATVNSQELLSHANDRANLPTFLPGGLLSTLGGGGDSFQHVNLTSTQFSAVLNFLDTTRNLNILSRPNILTAENKKADFRVGSRTPFVSEISQDGNFVNTAIDYEDLGLTVEVTPRINSADQVTLDILITDGDIDESVPPLNGALTFTDRRIDTELVVHNRNTVFIAGLISEREFDEVNRVPLLWRLPLVGDKAFTNIGKSREKVELLTFITPYIIVSRSDMEMATKMRRDGSKSKHLMGRDLRSGDWPVEELYDPSELDE